MEVERYGRLELNNLLLLKKMPLEDIARATDRRSISKTPGSILKLVIVEMKVRVLGVDIAHCSTWLSTLLEPTFRS